MVNEEQINMYLEFRKELDKMCVPTLLENSLNVTDIEYKGKKVGILCTAGDYIDCVYIFPEYRRKGLAKKAVLDWFYQKNRSNVQLHIINGNIVAKRFWENIFELDIVEYDEICTFYEILGVKNDRETE